MEITSVRYTANGYAVNNQFFIPNDSDKPIDQQDFYYKKIVEWIAAGGIVAPEFTTSENIDNLRQSLIASRIKYLLDTDFRVLRFIDEGTDYPNEIKAKRIRARQEINAIEAATTFAKINLFSVDFE